MAWQKHRIVGLVFISLLAAACGDDDDGGNNNPDAAPIDEAGTVIGVVSDIGNGGRISGATVTGGGKTATTDERGEFILTGVAAGEVSVAIEKEGYAPGFAVAQTGEKAAPVVVSLKQQGAMQAYDPTTTQTLSEITEAGPYAVIFPADSLDTTDTSLMVSVTPLDPTKERQALPGSLVAGGDGGTPLIPVTFAEFTILDSSGNRVQLKSSASAIVELPIPPSLRASYPLGEKIHCYAYNPASGTWDDFVEGTVQLSTVDGTSPVLAASVRHFSWYGGAPQGTNCADVYVSVKSAVDGRPLGNARVEASPGTVAYTDANGDARVVAAIGNQSSQFTAYQTGFDVDGSLTGIPGAKYIEFGTVEEELVGLVPRDCSGSGKPATSPRAADGSGMESDPIVIKVGLIEHLLYEANAILGATGVTVVLEGGVPGPDGELVDPQPASGAIITLSSPGAAPVTLSEIAPMSGVYGATTPVTITPGVSYSIAIDTEGDGSFEGHGTVVAVGELAWLNPTPGADVESTGLVASWSDTGTAAGNAAYAPVYYVSISNSGGTDGSVYVGTDRQFDVTSFVTQGAALPAGTYDATLVGFSGFNAVGGGVTTTNNITGTGVTGVFYSSSSAEQMSFTVH